MKMILEKENYLRNSVREIIAINPMVSIRALQEKIREKTGHSIGDKYLMKLIEKIRRQVVIESDRKLLNERVSEVREKFRALIDSVNRIVYWDYHTGKEYRVHEPTTKERLNAIKLLGQLELALFRAELNSGAFEKNTISVKQDSPKNKDLQKYIHSGNVGVELIQTKKVPLLQEKHLNCC